MKKKNIFTEFLKYFKEKIRAFSLIELLISLIIISILAAAFAPTVTKKLKSHKVAVSSGGGGITTKCQTKFSADCEVCLASKCIVCKKHVPEMM